MKRLIWGLGAALVLGCGQSVPSGEPFGLTTDASGISCGASAYLEGLLIPDTTYGTMVQDAKGDTTRVIWRMGYSALRLAGGEVVVLDRDGKVVATTGRSYRIGGQNDRAFGGFWACADDVRPR